MGNNARPSRAKSPTSDKAAHTRINGGSPRQKECEPGTLSPRELLVLQLLARGNTAAAIAATLSVSLHTVQSHIKNTYRKLGASNRVQALNIAVSEGLLSKTD